MIIKNNKGLTILECIIAIFLTTIMVVSLVSMQSLSWTGASRSDYLGRAQGLLQRELEIQESAVMGGNLSAANVTACLSNNCGTAVCGTRGAVFTIKTLRINNGANITGTWLVNVNVTWPKSTKGITSSIIVAPLGEGNY